MTISIMLIGSILATVLSWVLIAVAIGIVMFGDDRAFVVGPLVATVAVSIFWAWQLGVIVFV